MNSKWRISERNVGDLIKTSCKPPTLSLQGDVYNSNALNYVFSDARGKNEYVFIKTVSKVYRVN